ncbi:MAG: MiaB/RimO family radical SAM methylthiotransferase, partial [Candidatus Staskawiczbacteria bacterium]|nr:MiaB/RimO family radical SAM methylthiotransferase [Candidatus Staskawiczbacteria bacterium]
MKYHVIVFGCQMNISDAERVSAVLESVGGKATANLQEADLVVITMCSVRQSAVDRVHGLVEKFKELRKKNPNFKTILTGCVLKRDKKKFFEGFNYVIDIKDIKKLPEIIGGEFFASRQKNNHNNYLNITPKYSSEFSANVPIMTGCNNFCAYCVVPYARGREVSRPAQEIVQEIKSLTNPTSPRLRGAREIWLLGQNVNSYCGLIRTNGPTVDFADLLEMVNKIPGDFWIRFTSSHPKDFNKKVIEALAIGNKITPYLNLPVQAGDDKVLKSMNRYYTIKDYKNKIKMLREKIPDIAISTDIIVGFPGETKKQFENTVKLFRDVKYDMAYINKYSPRA